MGQWSEPRASPFYCNTKFGIFPWSGLTVSNLLGMHKDFAFFYDIYIPISDTFHYSSSNDKNSI